MKKTTTSNSLNRFVRLIATGYIVLLQGCSTPSYDIKQDARMAAAAENPTAPSEKDFPDIGHAVWGEGAFPNIETLRNMHKGMGKDQVRGLLSWPHFREGISRVHEWNYIFHLRTGEGAEYVTCQYMVRFNADYLTNGMYWKPSTCADLV
jgi:OmpA-OmpF porin, OOP family